MQCLLFSDSAKYINYAYVKINSNLLVKIALSVKIDFYKFLQNYNLLPRAIFSPSSYSEKMRQRRGCQLVSVKINSFQLLKMQMPQCLYTTKFEKYHKAGGPTHFKYFTQTLKSKRGNWSRLSFVQLISKQNIARQK